MCKVPGTCLPLLLTLPLACQKLIRESSTVSEERTSWQQLFSALRKTIDWLYKDWGAVAEGQANAIQAATSGFPVEEPGWPTITGDVLDICCCDNPADSAVSALYGLPAASNWEHPYRTHALGRSVYVPRTGHDLSISRTSSQEILCHSRRCRIRVFHR